MLAMVTVHEDRSWQRPHRADKSDRLIAWDAVISDGEMDVAQAELSCRLDFGPRPINTDNRLDSQSLETFGTPRGPQAVPHCRAESSAGRSSRCLS